MTRTPTALESPARRRIVVVGGVAGGMSFAARARRLDENAEILVLERGPHVSFASCGLPYFVGGEIAEESQLLLQTPSSLAASLELDVRTGHEVVGLDAERRCVTVQHAGGTEEIGYDELVLAPGARAVRPPVPGLDSPRVHVLRSVQDALAMRELAEREGYDLATSYAYSDSITDVPMLEAVGHAVVVNPDRTLRRLAVERGWEVARFSHPQPLSERLRPVAPAAAVGGAALAIGVGALVWRAVRKRRGA